MNLGVFDSGLGGLTVLKEILKNNSFAKIVYFGDTARVPYGDRDRETLFKFAKEDISFLRSKGVDEIVIACGTISSNVLNDIKGDYDFPLTGIIDAACKDALNKTKNKKIGVIATKATINTGAFKNKLLELDNNLEVSEVACPKLTILIEQGKINTKEMDEALNEYLCNFKDIDTLILGCTHYPLLSDKINDYFKNKVNLINSGTVISQEIFKGDTVKPEIEFYVSGDKETFIENGKKFLDIPELNNTKNI